MDDRLQTLKNNLYKSPLYHMSLSSKELFHSNFWGWLFETYYEIAFGVFNIPLPGTLSEHPTIKREAKNIDLTVSYCDHVVYIENKVKDVAHPYQLEKYLEKLKADNADFILVTLNTPRIVPDGWKVITYKELAQSMRHVETGSRYHNMLLQDYSELIANLSLLMELLPSDEVYDFMYSRQNEHWMGVLNELRLHDMYVKYRSSQFAGYVYERLKHDQHNTPFVFGVTTKDVSIGSVTVNWTYNNRQGTIDYKFVVSTEIIMGIQVQNDQYRYFVETRNAHKVGQRLLDTGVWFRRDWRSRRGLELCNYGSAFKYQYEAIEYGVSYEYLYQKMKLDLEYLQSMRDEILDLLK